MYVCMYAPMLWVYVCMYVYTLHCCGYMYVCMYTPMLWVYVCMYTRSNAVGICMENVKTEQVVYVCMYVCMYTRIFLQHCRIHMDIGITKNYLRIKNMFTTVLKIILNFDGLSSKQTSVKTCNGFVTTCVVV